MDSQGIDRTSNSSATPIPYMGVDHGGFHVFVTEQFLNGSDIIAILKHMCGLRVTDGLATGGGRRGIFFTDPVPVFSCPIFLVLDILYVASTAISREAQRWRSDWPGVAPFPRLGGGHPLQI